MSAPDWNPESYAAFADVRLRPAADLLAAVGPLPDKGPVVDLGCGAGAAGALLRARAAGRALVGVDLSPAMLERARATGAYDDLMQADAADWAPSAPPALIFSNALLQWVPDHTRHIARLVGTLAPAGWLAVQMPRQMLAPSHALLRSIAARLFPDLFDFSQWQPPVPAPAQYADALRGLGDLTLWETEYFQTLAPVAQGHPVRHFTQSTAMRPITLRLDAKQRDALVAAYDAALAQAYPAQADGRILFPFKRLFFTIRR